VDETVDINGRRMTNLGTFRAYVTAYLKQHPGIHKGLIMMVRQLQPTETGIPLEIYAFTRDTAWVNYEGIQSDIFDHMLAVLAHFDLRVVQMPTGNDLKSLRDSPLPR
jgi:miniconductance mechanosensitive channel